MQTAPFVELLAVPAALANGPGENSTWQFQTTQERVNKAAIADLVEKKQAGYYDSFKAVYNYNTYIDKQVNCTLSAVTNGTSGANGLDASTSSPVLNNTGTTSASVARPSPSVNWHSMS